MKRLFVFGAMLVMVLFLFWSCASTPEVAVTEAPDAQQTQKEVKNVPDDALKEPLPTEEVAPAVEPAEEEAPAEDVAPARRVVSQQWTLTSAELTYNGKPVDLSDWQAKYILTIFTNGEVMLAVHRTDYAILGTATVDAQGNARFTFEEALLPASLLEAVEPIVGPIENLPATYFVTVTLEDEKTAMLRGTWDKWVFTAEFELTFEPK